MRYGLVVPRYGVEIFGGAELAARMLAEHAVADLGWSVEVFTTCARDHMTWADEYPAGDDTINGVVVHRFPSTVGRLPEFFSFSERLLSHPRAATTGEAERFVDLQGPTCPALIVAVAESSCDLLAFYPYLYATTVRALPGVAGRSVMHPAAHDEAALHLPVFRPTFTSVQGFAFHTDSERKLVERTFAVGHLPQVVLGLGCDPPDGEPDAGRGPGHRRPPTVAVLGDRPYLLAMGRVDGLKGTTMLAGFFAAYKRRRPGPLALVMAGPVTAMPPEHPDIVVTGAVDEADKWALIRGATALVQPSPHESFSIVLMEAWSQGLPALVNARCAVTRQHCQESGGGLWFEGYAPFEVAVDRLIVDAGLRHRLGSRGRRFVDANFRWPVVIDRYRRFAAEVVDRIENQVPDCRR